MKKRITQKDWTYIGKYNPMAKWIRPFCSYSLTKNENENFLRTVQVGLVPYVIVCIPLHLIGILINLWDGGLKEFRFRSRHSTRHSDTIKKDSSETYEKCEEIWTRK